MRLYIDGKNTRTIRMYTEAQVVADTGAETVIMTLSYLGAPDYIDVPPRASVVDDALAGIEFMSALERRDK
jgi:hypothetical protein